MVNMCRAPMLSETSDICGLIYVLQQLCELEMVICIS